jgi:hypothetical protein
MNNNIEIGFTEMNTNNEVINTSMSFIPVTAGSRNEEGFINGLNRQGFTTTKCGSEKLANCIDAYADNIQFKITPPYIILCDDGIGMTPEKLCNMFDANRENHSGDKSMGVSGIGGIISNYQLSKDDHGSPREVNVFTKHKDGPYIKAIIPWDFIHTHKKYDGQINISQMNEIEIENFKMERRNFGNLTGTTIYFQYSAKFHQLLESQFISRQEDGRNLENWWPIIFGKTQTNILLDKCDGLQPIPLKKYDYFSGPNTEFYCGVFKWDIYFISDNEKDRFISKNPDNHAEYIEITEKGNGFSKSPNTITINPRKIDNAQTIKFTCGMRKDDRVFNPEDPLKSGTLSATFYLNKYDAEFMSESRQKDVTKEFCSKNGVIRNSQKVTSFTIEGCNVGSARANGDTLIKNVLHRSEISYETYSKQENNLDIKHGIQQNKNQNQNEFPKQYTRLIKYLKEWHYAKMMKYFNDVKELAQKKITAEQDRKKAEQKKIRAEKKAEEEKIRAEQERIRAEQERIRAEQERIRAEQERIRAEKKAEEEKIRAQIDAANALLQQQEEDDEESSEEEEEVEDDEDSNGEEEDETSSDGQEVEHDEDSNGEVEDDKDEKQDVNKIFEESKKCEKEAALLLMDHVEGLSYNKTNGKEMLDFVKQYLNKK